MPVKIACPNPDCDASYSVTDEKIGRVGRCKKCGTTFPLVPATQGGTTPRMKDGRDTQEAPRASSGGDLPAAFGRYDIIRTLGQGGMGAVYLARDSQLDRLVALKVPHREFARDPEVRERFLREARAAARFQHPNFCPIHDIGEVGGLPYLTMAYIQGGTLASEIERGRPWDQRRAAEVVRTLAVALAEAHRQGVVHRDLKPANVMIDARGGLVLMDFGLARRLEGDDATLTAAGAVMGTPGYMSPEQAEGRSKEVGPRSDVYSLGVILYELICGRRPFEGSVVRVLALILTAEPPDPSELHPGVDPGLEAACLKAMAKESNNRHASMDEFARVLQAWLDEKPVRQARPTRKPKVDEIADGDEWPDRPASSRSRIAALAAAGVVLAGLVASVVVYRWRGEARIDEPVEVVLGDASPSSVPHEPVAVAVAVPVPVAPKGIQTSTGMATETAPPTPTAAEIPRPPARVPPPAPPPRSLGDEPVANSLGMRFKWLPAGEFEMGTNDGEADERPKHKVRIARPFEMGTTEVTVGQFRRFVEAGDYKTDAERSTRGGFGWDSSRAALVQSKRYDWRTTGFYQSDEHPVVNVSWVDAREFCSWLEFLERKSYRLPTEAEWEYACRAGSTSRYSTGDDPEGLATVGNVSDATALARFPKSPALRARDGYTFSAPVGRFRPNAWGLYDMHGNVWEWCYDRYAKDYYARVAPAVEDPTGPTGGILDRVLRGGSWYVKPDNKLEAEYRSSYRNFETDSASNPRVGFRVVRVP